MSLGARRASSLPLGLFNDLAAALSCGAGYGAMHVVMAYGALLGAATQSDAAFYWEGCALSAYILSALMSALYTLLHLALQVLATDALRCWAAAAAAAGAPGGARALPPPAVALQLATPALLHVTLALLSTGNASGACAVTMPLIVLTALAAAILAAARVRRREYAGNLQMARVAAAAAATSRLEREAAAAAAAARGARGSSPFTPRDASSTGVRNPVSNATRRGGGSEGAGGAVVGRGEEAKKL